MSTATSAGAFLEASWQAAIGEEFQKPYMQTLKAFLRQEKDNRKIIYPHSKNVFKAFEYAPLEKVKVVILGQDPYHGVGQAHGLSFSVLRGVAIPPSLQNIYRELHDDVGILPVSHGCLVSWARQGVLLLNSVLTVEQGKAASHQGKGWEIFTDKVIAVLNQQPRSIAFVL
jgi:uracil-DNA glycosylase